MTLISKYAIALKIFLENLFQKDNEQKFKIFIRAGFRIDVYIFARELQNLKDDIEKRFDVFCKDHSEFSDLAHINGNNSIRIFFNILPISDLDDPFYSNIANDSNNIDYGPRYRFDSFLGKVKNEIIDRSKFPPVITFYSYKGGMGRTTTMISYAMHLASEKGKKVAVIDCDLEAPGYLNFFNLSEHPELKNGKKNGLVEFLCDSQFDNNNIDIYNYILNVGADKKSFKRHPELENIWIIPAGNLNDSANDGVFSQSRLDYLEGLAKINLGNTQNIINGFNRLFEQLKKLNFDIILIDSRTGFNDIFGSSILYLSTCVVGFFGLSRQTEPGFMNLLNIHSKLLKDPNKNETCFKLILTYSILPKEINDIPIQMRDFINRSYENTFPAQFFIHRNPDLERIGTGDLNIDEKFIEMNTSESHKTHFEDYVLLFEGIDDFCFPEKKHSSDYLNFDSSAMEKNISITEISSTTPTYILRNAILHHLEKIWGRRKKNNTIEKEIFFFRECAKKIFNPQKFIIQGNKGSGKTYLCNALQNHSIFNNIQNWANIDHGVNYTCINLSPKTDDAFLYIFSAVQHEIDRYKDHIHDLEISDHYYNYFWHFYTWNKLLYDDGDENLTDIRQKVINNSHLITNLKIIPLGGMISKQNYKKFIDKIIKHDCMFCIDDDLKNFNKELKEHNKKVILFYDRHDSNYYDWDRIVFFLIKSWQKVKLRYRNILPKFCINTDLMHDIKNTDDLHLSNNIVNTEWSTEEIFGYFFKLAFSTDFSAKACWCIAEKLGCSLSYITSTKKIFAENYNQFSTLSRTEMDPLIQVFFGKYVNELGKPWDYFNKELSSANNKLVNLNYFINILKGNAVSLALKSERFIKEVIPPTIYTSKNVLQKATEQHLKELTQDEFCKPLLKFKDVVCRDGNFRYKSLNSNTFNMLIEETLEALNKSYSNKKFLNLKDLIFTNGIMAEKTTTKGLFYVFAPIYWDSWHLSNGHLEGGWFFFDPKIKEKYLKLWEERNRENEKETQRSKNKKRFSP